MDPLARLRRFVFGAPRPRGTEFHDLAKRVKHVPDGESAVIEAALADGGPIADRLLRQLRDAGHVWRLIADDGSYELRISTTDDLRVRDVPRRGWTSDHIPIQADGDGQPLELSVVVDVSGIVELHGRTLDGRPWPHDWSARQENLDGIRARAPWLTLPTAAELRAARATAAATIATWLSDDESLRGRRGAVSVDPPASDDAVAAFAVRERFRLPEAYDSMLRRCDGIEVGPVVVMGTRDAYRLDMPGPTRLVIAPPNEDGAFTLSESGEVVWVEIDAMTTDGKVVAADLRQWVASRLTRNAKAGT